MSRVVAQVVLLLALGAAIGWWISPGRGIEQQAGLPACQYEDGPGPCYWDAKTRGNGTGRSFVIDSDGTVVYR